MTQKLTKRTRQRTTATHAQVEFATQVIRAIATLRVEMAAFAIGVRAEWATEKRRILAGHRSSQLVPDSRRMVLGGMLFLHNVDVVLRRCEMQQRHVKTIETYLEQYPTVIHRAASVLSQRQYARLASLWVMLQRRTVEMDRATLLLVAATACNAADISTAPDQQVEFGRALAEVGTSIAATAANRRKLCGAFSLANLQGHLRELHATYGMLTEDLQKLIRTYLGILRTMVREESRSGAPSLDAFHSSVRTLRDARRTLRRPTHHS